MPATVVRLHTAVKLRSDAGVGFASGDHLVFWFRRGCEPLDVLRFRRGRSWLGLVMLIPKRRRRVFYIVYLLVLAVAGFFMLRYLLTSEVRQAVRETYLPAGADN
jgi:hypothetical protein